MKEQHNSSTELAQLRERLSAQDNVIQRLTAKVEQLEQALSSSPPSSSQSANVGDAAPPLSNAPTSRRNLLKWGGLGAAAALTAVGAAGLGQAPIAHASDGGSLILGSGNTAEHGTGIGYDGSESFPTGFLVDITVAEAGLGIVAEAGDGVFNYAAGVQASAGAATNFPTYGVNGFVGIGGTGVIGSSNAAGNSGGIGVHGDATGAGSTGVLGTSDVWYGVESRSNSWIDLIANGTGRFLQKTAGFIGAPTSGVYGTGEQLRDANGDLYICITGGGPGIWRKVAAGVPGVSGAINFLANPIRLLDTRTSSPFLSGSTHSLQVTGVVIGGISVPAGAIGVVGNVTVVGPTGGGDLRLYPGATAPSTSSINFASGQTIANGVTVGLNSSGKLNIKVDMPSGQKTNVLFDASGYIL